MNEIDSVLLAAGDVWEMVIGFIFFIMWTVAQLLSSRREAKAKKPKRPRPAQPIDMAGGQDAVPKNQEDALRSEVEEFLRRAQGRPKPTDSAVQPTATKLEPTESTRAKPQPPAIRPAAKASKDTTVESNKRRQPTNPQLSYEPATPKVVSAGKRLERQPAVQVDHELGSLEHQEPTDTTSKPRNDVAADIAEMLRSPQGVRQLIIANEVLRRPEW